MALGCPYDCRLIGIMEIFFLTHSPAVAQTMEGSPFYPPVHQLSRPWNSQKLDYPRLWNAAQSWWSPRDPSTLALFQHSPCDLKPDIESFIEFLKLRDLVGGTSELVVPPTLLNEEGWHSQSTEIETPQTSCGPERFCAFWSSKARPGAELPLIDSVYNRRTVPLQVRLRHHVRGGTCRDGVCEEWLANCLPWHPLVQ